MEALPDHKAVIKKALLRYTKDKLQLAFEQVEYSMGEYEFYLSVLHYIPYEVFRFKDIVSNSFSVFFKELIGIIESYYSALYGIEYGINRYKSLFNHLFMKFLYNYGPKQCGVPVSIYLVRSKQKTSGVRLNRNNIIRFIERCFQNNSDVVSIPLSLRDKKYGHANTLVLSKLDKRITRVEPNFKYNKLSQEAKAQFDIDNLKTGKYPFYADYVNQALYRYFRNNPIVIDGVVYPFEGYEPKIIEKTCPAHGSMCKAVSSLTYFLDKKVSRKLIKFYVIKYFEWEYRNIFLKPFKLESIDQVLDAFEDHHITIQDKHDDELLDITENVKSKDYLFLQDYKEFFIIIDVGGSMYNIDTEKLYLSNADPYFERPLVAKNYQARSEETPLRLPETNFGQSKIKQVDKIIKYLNSI
jgi:hypothetical protein